MELENEPMVSKKQIVEMAGHVAESIAHDPHCIVASNACRLLASVKKIQGCSDDERSQAHKGFVQLFNSNREWNLFRSFGGPHKPVLREVGFGVSINEESIARKYAMDGLKQIEKALYPDGSGQCFKKYYQSFKLSPSEQASLDRDINKFTKGRRAEGRHRRWQKIKDFF